jgi:glycosyltransferase involved in cell wall biosynthesis
MRIAIEALGIHYFGGGRTATLNLLEALFALDTQNEYLVFLSQPETSLQTCAANVRQVVAPVKNRLALRIWAQLYLPFATRNYDLVHFVKNLGVFGLPTRSIVTVYDMTTLIHPELFPRLDVLYWRYIEKLTLSSADHVIAISQNTASDITHLYGIPPTNIRIIYPSYAPHFKPADAADIARVRDKYGLPSQFVIHVGRIDRKKNLSTLVEAFGQLRERTSYDGKLVLVGEIYRKSQDLTLTSAIERRGLRKQILFTGPVPDTDVAALYGAASVAVFPSLHEGFGLVALEAMACGTPLITSRAGAVAEVVGDAAIILESDDPDALANALVKLVKDPLRRQEMRDQGLAQARHFSREDTASQTLQLYKEIVEAR